MVIWRKVRTPFPHSLERMRFFKIGCNGGMRIFTRNWGFFLSWGGWEVFLHSWQRGANPLLYKPTPLPCHLQPPFPLFLLLSYFFGWMGDQATFDVLFYVMIIWISTCRSLVPYTRRTLMCALCNKTSNLLRSDT